MQIHVIKIWGIVMIRIVRITRGCGLHIALSVLVKMRLLHILVTYIYILVVHHGILLGFTREQRSLNRVRLSIAKLLIKEAQLLILDWVGVGWVGSTDWKHIWGVRLILHKRLRLMTFLWGGTVKCLALLVGVLGWTVLWRLPGPLWLLLYILCLRRLLLR